MLRLTLRELEGKFRGDSLPKSLHHPWGWLLQDAGEVLTPDRIDLLASAGIEDCCLVEGHEDIEELIRDRTSREVRAENLEEGMTILEGVFDPSGNRFGRWSRRRGRHFGRMSSDLLLASRNPV